MPAGVVVGRERVVAGGAGPLGQRLGQRGQAQPLGVPHHGDDQALEVQVDGDAEVDALVDVQPVGRRRGR